MRSTGSRRRHQTARPRQTVMAAKGDRLVAQYPNPADHPFFQAHPMHKEHIKAAYHDTTQDERSLGDRWYPDAHHVAKGITTTHSKPHGDAALGAGLLSAYSPQTAWPVNLFNASRAARGDPPGPGSGAMGSQQRPAIRMLAGAHHSDVLNAPKTRDFAHLIEHGGDTESDTKTGSQKVVVDRHALSVARPRLNKDETQGFPSGHRHFYEHVAQHYRDAAADLSAHYGRHIAPHQVQAATWLRQVRKNQEEDRAGMGGGGTGASKGRVVTHTRAQDRWHQHHQEQHPGGIPEENMHFRGHQKQAYGETRVPAQVDTLRMEECPVCGEHDVWSGDRCPVCGFIVPPSLFRDPDVTKAQQVRDELDQQGEVVTPGEPGDPGTQPMGSDPDASQQMVHPDQIAPDGVPAVQGGEPGQPVPGNEAQLPGQDAEAEGDAEAEQGEEDQERGQEEQAEGEQEAQDGQEEQLDPMAGSLMCPACGTTFAPDMAAQPGVPCPACRQGALEPAAGPQKDQEDPSEDEDKGKPCRKARRPPPR